MNTIKVTDTLTLTADNSGVVVSRVNGGLVWLDVTELRATIAGLTEIARALGVGDVDNSEGNIVRLVSPLPCGINGGSDVACGRPSLAAYLDPDPDRPGAWVLTPVCEVCAAAMAAMYRDSPADVESDDARS